MTDPNDPLDDADDGDARPAAAVALAPPSPEEAEAIIAAATARTRRAERCESMPPALAETLHGMQPITASPDREEARQRLAAAKVEALEDHRRQVLADRERSYRASLASRYHAARLSAFVARHSADAENLAKARGWLQKIAQGESPNLSLVGIPGTGKTWLMAAIGWALLPTAHPALYLRAPEGWEAIRNSYEPNAEQSERRLMGAWKGASVLMLDELGGGNVTSAYRAWVSELVCSRHDNGLPTVVASNLSLERWADAADQRMVDRMAEAGSPVLIVAGPSRRSGL